MGKIGQNKTETLRKCLKSGYKCLKVIKKCLYMFKSQKVAAALLVAAAYCCRTCGYCSIMKFRRKYRIQRYCILSFILTEFIIFEKLPFAIDVLQICCNLQHTITQIKGWAFQIDRTCKNTRVTQVWHTIHNLKPWPKNLRGWDQKNPVTSQWLEKSVFEYKKWILALKNGIYKWFGHCFIQSHQKNFKFWKEKFFNFLELRSGWRVVRRWSILVVLSGN